jgi:hypothetical protein
VLLIFVTDSNFAHDREKFCHFQDVNWTITRNRKVEPRIRRQVGHTTEVAVAQDTGCARLQDNMFPGLNLVTYKDV